MTRGSFGRLELYWKTPAFISPLRVPAWHIHNQHKNHVSQHHRRASLSTFYCRQYSNIVQSPFKDIDIPNKLVPECIWETVDKFPDSTAIKCGVTGRAYTFAEIQKLSYRFANSLRQAGFVKGDTIALVLPNCPEHPIITLGALEADLTLCFINHAYTADEMCYQIKDSGSVCIVVASERLDTVLSAVAKVEEKTRSKTVQKIVAMDIPHSGSLPSGVIRLSEMIGSNADSTPKHSKKTPSELAFLPYSSGTTGLPKGVCLSQRNVISNILQLFTIDGIKIYSPAEHQDIVLGILPFYHIYGLVMIQFTSLYHGAQIVTLPKFDQDSFINTLENEKLTKLMLAPPLILFLSHSNRVLPKHLANANMVASGSAPLGADDVERFKMKLPPGNNCITFQAYGMTELSPAALCPTVPPKDVASVGVPVSNTFAKIINPDSGEALGPHESGELLIKGPQMMSGYHNNPKATSDTIDSEGWLRTGDLAYYDEDRHFYIKDRLKELIKVKGFQVAPAELEEVLRTHPSVNDVGVIGVPCARTGETPIAYVVAKKDSQLTADDIKHFLEEKVSQHKRVSKVIFIDSIPKSPAGKILRKDLKQMYNQ